MKIESQIGGQQELSFGFWWRPKTCQAWERVFPVDIDFYCPFS